MSLTRAFLGSRVRALSLIALGLSLSACQDPLELVVTPESLTVEADHDRYDTPPLRLTGTIRDLDQPIYVGVTHTTGSVERAAYSTSKTTIDVEVHLKAPSSLAVGEHQDFVTFFACEDENCEQHLRGSPKVVPLSYRVHDPLTFDPTQLRASVTIGSSATSPLLLALGGAGVDWSAWSSPGWLHLETSSGTTPANVTATVDSLALAPGENKGSLSFVSKVTKVERQVPVSIWATLPVLSAPNALTFAERTGEDFAPQPLTFSLDTGTHAYAWTAKVHTDNGLDWLSLSSSSGRVSSDALTVTARVNASGFEEGIHKATITLAATVGGRSVRREVPVTLNVVGHKVLVPDNGVALVSTPTVRKLTRTVTVQDSFGLTTTPWTASSDSPWLSVTPSGMTGGPLTLTANPSGLTPDTLYTATVTLTSSDPTVLNQERLRVGFWVGTSAAEVERPWDSSSAYNEAFIQADPIRPYVYLTDGSSRLDVYNLYTGAQVTTLSVAGAWLREMAVSHDVSTLYVEDVRNGRTSRIDLDTFSVRPGFTGASFWFTYARTGGVGILLDSGGRAIDALTGVPYEAKLAAPEALSSGPAASRDGSTVCLDNKCYTLLYPGTLSITPPRVFPLQYLYPDSALNREGSRIYRANGRRSNLPPFHVFDGRTLEEVRTFGSAPADSFWVEVGPEDQLVCAARASAGVTDIWLQDGAGKSLGSLTLTGPADSYARLALSGDGQRLVAVYASASVVRFVNLP